ncbi:MAG: tRNA preQ1(34) S-adenosylmethionine ribosyltransferase-isomerase QueA [Gemmatimonadetes bacterium]|nr:tRNA preQ1(34) S-adenosylmethionine ribosyltransferase-isomerase QueA [Gemmatimonadota bacterium]
MSTPDGSRTSHYDYELPEALIAQEPVEPRDASRLLVVDRAQDTLAHRVFRDLDQLVAPGDALVVNTTQVFKARLLGTREGGGPAELLLLRPLAGADGDLWEAMIHPGGKLRPGRRVTVAPDFSAEIVDTTPRRTRVVRLHAAGSPSAAIARHGHVPLPPYIQRADQAADTTRYQTVYAREAGSVAAPTAGLHFTEALLDRLAARGVARVELLLHVGPGTFRPISDDDPSLHVMHEEWYEVRPEAAAALNAVRARGGKLWAVGTTTVRTLETVADDAGVVHAGSGMTDLFLRPPYAFKAVDRLITNFHLPKSTLVMLVAAFAGYERTMAAYRTAVAERYRFYSYGDAMCLL